MTKVISKKSNVFKFVDDMDDSVYFTLKITIITKKYEDNREFFYIEYRNKGSSSGKYINSAHPFYHERKKYKTHLEGDIIFKNPISIPMINMLLLNDEVLEKYTGNVTAQTYRGSIMRMLCMITD